MSGKKLNADFIQAAQMFLGGEQPAASSGRYVREYGDYTERNQRGYTENPGSFESAQRLRVCDQFGRCADYHREIPLGRDVYAPRGERFIVPGAGVPDAGFRGSEFRGPIPASPNMPGSLTAQPPDQYPGLSYEDPGVSPPMSPFGFGR